MNGNPADNKRHKTMYATRNFKSKKEFKAAVDAWNAWQAASVSYVSGAPTLTVGAGIDNPRPAAPVTYFQPGPFGGNEPRDGTIYIEGPHYPEAHRFYAQCIAKDGVIVKVK